MSPRRRIPVFVALVVAVVCVPSGATELSHDGFWWESISSAEQTGYLFGYLHCANYDAKVAVLKGTQSEPLQARVSTYYKTQSSKRDRSVASVMILVAQPKSKPSPRGGEEYPEKYGWVDGNYWRMIREEQQLGFVEGYTDCLKVENVKAPRFSKPASWYRTRVSEWFGTRSEDQGVIRPDRESEKIAVVLWRLGD